KLVQLAVDGARLPMPFDQIQCADLAGWNGDIQAPGWRKVIASIAELTSPSAVSRAAGPQASRAPARKLSICVLPFANISGDVEQEYFSDGISEDIITDLSKVSALSVVARNTAFTFKGRAVDVGLVAGQLNVTHILEGSVRKAGARVRITAQLIDGAVGRHLWAERWDRDLTDIFALQDEISQAIVKALRLRLLPEEKKAIERRGTTSSDAYNLYLMARQYYVTGNAGDNRREDEIIRLCRRATQIDPGYARAWALMARAQTAVRFYHGREGDTGLAAAERALLLDPALAEAHAVKADNLRHRGHDDEAWAEVVIALRLDAESYEANATAGYLSFRQGRLEEAIRYYEAASALMEADFKCAGMLTTCYTAVGDTAGARRAAGVTLARSEKAVAQDESNGAAIGWGVIALGVLGEADRARSWVQRALLIDPENMNMRYNFACALSIHLEDADAALDLLEPYFATTLIGDLNHAKVDPDLEPIRADPRFAAMIAAAETRLAAAADAPGPSTTA
ncbi:MAG TPA: hypothetical protein VII63_09760, partial [Caulobacteraceae bacterium]